MGFLDSILGLSPSAESIFPHDASDERAWTRTSSSRDYWGGHSGSSSTGLYVRPDDALGVSCIFLGTRIYAELLGTRPLLFYRLTDSSGSPSSIREATKRSPGLRIPLIRHPIARLLAPSHGTQPNQWQTGAQWRIVTIAHCVLWGLGLSEIEWDQERGMQLIPVDPDWITDIDETKNRQSRYKVSEPGRTSRILTQDQVFRFEGFGTHSRIPESLLKRSREAVSVWLAQQQFMGSYYRRGAQPSLIAKYTGAGSLGDEQDFARMQSQIQGALGGPANFHKVGLVQDIDLKEVGHTARNAQASELIKSQAIEIGTRYMGLPAHLFGGENPPYASREYVMQELVQIPLSPKGVLFEGAVHRDLITEDDVICEHDYDGLLQGSFLEQVQALSIAVMSALLAENEARERLGYEPVEGLDEPRRSANMDRGGDPRGPREKEESARTATTTSALTDRLLSLLVNERMISGTQSAAPSLEDREESLRRASHPADRRALENSAQQVLKHEIQNLTEKARKYASNPDAWRSWLTSFYRSHTERVADAMAVDEGAARAYTEEHRVRVLQEGVGVVEEWSRDGIGVREMVRLAIGEETDR